MIHLDMVSVEQDACPSRELGFTSRQLRNFAHARAAAELSDFRVKVGAVATLGPKIIGIGYNSTRSNPLQMRMDVAREFRDSVVPSHSRHAEIDCLASLIGNKDINWGRVELYIYRIRKDRPHGMARPCKACEKLILSLGIKHIYYTTDVGHVYECVS